MTIFRSCLFLSVIQLCIFRPLVLSFSISSTNVHYQNGSRSFVHVKNSVRLFGSGGVSDNGGNGVDVSISNPSPEEAANMGCRDWPQKTKSRGVFVETCKENQSLTRYVLDGTGTLDVPGKVSSRKLNPGTLIEIQGGPTEVSWNVQSEEMIILTPGYEETGSFVAILVAMIAICGTLIATLGS